MTSLVAWVGVDPRGQSSFYFATDSRISWGAERSRDTGKKVFASRRHPDIFAYFGEALFPTTALQQVLEFIEYGLYAVDFSCQQCHEKVATLIKELHAASNNAIDDSFTIYHCIREGRSYGSRFLLWQVSYRHRDKSWSDTPLVFAEDKSNLVLAEGTGKGAIEEHFKRWQATAVSGTSRAIFSAFCDALFSAVDKLSGGAPQLVALYRDGPGQIIGIAVEDMRFFSGCPVPPGADLTNVTWRDRLFQRIDGQTLKLLDGATPQPRPKGV